MNAEDIIRQLGLLPHPKEGGYFRETYRSPETVPTQGLPARYPHEKAFSTAIYYLLTPDTFSAMHRVRSDEVFHFYAGDPVQMLQLHPDGSHSIAIIGNDLAAGHVPQVVVAAGTWQGCMLVDGGRYALMGATVAPAFDYDDYEHGDRAMLSSRYPDCARMIERLTVQ